MAEQLNKKGFVQNGIGPSSSYSFHDLLKNEKYKGLFMHGKTEAPLGKQHIPKQAHIIIEDGVPAIIEPEIWERMNEKIKQKNADKTAKRSCLLSGLIYCGACGEYMSRNSIFASYDCTGRRKKKNGCKMRSVKKSI